MIGNNLKAVRKQGNLTQLELSELLGLKRVTIATYENDKATPSLEVLLKYSSLFNIPIDSLVSDVGIHSIENKESYIIGDNLCLIRKRYGLSQSKLGEALNISRNTIATYENNNSTPSLDALIKYSNLFNISLDTIVFGKDIENKSERNDNMNENGFTLVYTDDIPGVIEKGRIYYKHKMYEFDSYFFKGNSYIMVKYVDDETFTIVGELEAESNSFVYRKMKATDDVPEHFWFMEVVE